MANLDSRAKRASAIGIDIAWSHVYPNPDGTLDVSDRQQSAYKYSGISSSIIVVTGIQPYRTLLGVGG